MNLPTHLPFHCHLIGPPQSKGQTIFRNYLSFLKSSPRVPFKNSGRFSLEAIFFSLIYLFFFPKHFGEVSLLCVSEANQEH